MSLEASHEHTEQELPAASAETGHNSVDREKSKGEQPPTNDAPAQVLPDFDTFVALLRAWIRTPDWFSSQTYLQTHPELLMEEATHVLGLFLQRQPDQRVHEHLRLHQLLLSAAQQLGVEIAYQALLSQEGNLADLDATLTAFQQAVQATSASSSDWAIRLNDLGNALYNRYRYTGHLTDLDDAIKVYQQAILVAPPNSSDCPGFLNNLAICLNDRYRFKGDMADLNDAIKVYQQAILATPPDSFHQSGLSNNLAICLNGRYQYNGDMADLDASITAFQQAVQESPPDSSNRISRLNNLGNGLRDRYTRTGDLTDLEAAISAYQQAVQAVPSNLPYHPGYLSNLGNGLRDRYARTGDLTDLEAAITAFQQAVQDTPSDSPDLIARLNNLGNGLRDRYIRTGDLADLEAAISAYQQAVQATSPDSPDQPTLLGNLGGGLQDRYARTGNLIDLEAAISAYQQAIQATLSDSPDRPGYLSNLGNGLRDRYTRTRDLADLEAAISTYQQAIQATLPGSPDQPGYLNNLGNGLQDRYARTGDLADLEAAITAYQQAVQTTLSDSPNWPGYLNNLGGGLRDRYTRTGDQADLEAAIMAWERSWSIPHPRFTTLPVTYQLGQQQQGIRIAAHLVTAYLEQAKQRHPRSSNAPRRTLEIAEGSKSRLLTQLVGRGPLPIPEGLSPEIAIQEQQLLTNLTALDTQELASHHRLASPQSEDARHFSRLQQRQTALRELEDLWARIAHVGPEGAAYVALRRGASPTWQEFVSLTKALGPATALLSFFTTAERTLLFLMRAGWRVPRMVEVPLNQAGWTDLVVRFFREVHRSGVAPKQTGRIELVERSFRVDHDKADLPPRETWDQPLISLFTRARHYLEGIERLIIAPNGIGHLLPWGILAERAGCSTSIGQPLPLITLPALGILPRLRQRPHVPPGSALVVGNPCGDLPYAEDEARMVAEQFETNPLLGTAATRSEVLARLPDATLIHLATHAFFDSDNPLESGIVLADGVITAREVLQHRLQTDLLVLSACESGQVGSLGGEELAGLSQAFLQAGVRSLVVSLWRVDDPATAAFSQAFYTARQDGADKAQALRQAMTQIQQDPRWTHPYYWGAFTFVGDWD